MPSLAATIIAAAITCAPFLSPRTVTAAEAKPVPASSEKIILVGDSTVASKSGWGDAFGKLARSEVTVVNLALGGRSSKSFRDEGHWQKVLDAKPAPTWVLIQFGHNDQPGKGPKRETDAKTTFRENLARYVTEVRAMGAQPVLITSLTRRNFNAQGRIEPGQATIIRNEDGQDEQRPDLLAQYAEGTRAVAAELKVPLLDLHARSIEQMNQLGPEAAVAFDAKSRNPAAPDKTHLSEKGAEETAKLIADEVRKNVPALAKLLQAPAQ
ncbi:rhamnogalacturonan acetylesterase [Roseimicrobium sp. ORNL1]|uniref:rhamnogalacturonan acetylesterase n=1 Tax=Roseimicrobium sp. ORNL1 TaxID=2711231 RepID=UPI0013E131C1|nr:rhamnogalacturonan acetylesterase [Roseimicrobium sp. ORNL1]QIF05481.1 rhamnogalacturonan acetylesterase [Roseimicrobium sp. ORNL1]